MWWSLKEIEGLDTPQLRTLESAIRRNSFKGEPLEMMLLYAEAKRRNGERDEEFFQKIENGAMFFCLEIPGEWMTEKMDIILGCENLYVTRLYEEMDTGNPVCYVFITSPKDKGTLPLPAPKGKDGEHEVPIGRFSISEESFVFRIWGDAITDGEEILERIYQMAGREDLSVKEIWEMGPEAIEELAEEEEDEHNA